MAVRIWLGASMGVGVLLMGCLVARALLLSSVPARLFRGRMPVHALIPALAGLAGVTLVCSVLLAGNALVAVAAANRVKAELRRRAVTRVLERGPAWPAGERVGELAVTLGRGMDALDVYVGNYLPRLVPAMLTPFVLGAWVSIHN